MQEELNKILEEIQQTPEIIKLKQEQARIIAENELLQAKMEFDIYKTRIEAKLNIYQFNEKKLKSEILNLKGQIAKLNNPDNYMQGSDGIGIRYEKISDCESTNKNEEKNTSSIDFLDKISSILNCNQSSPYWKHRGILDLIVIEKEKESELQSEESKTDELNIKLCELEYQNNELNKIMEINELKNKRFVKDVSEVLNSNDGKLNQNDLIKILINARFSSEIYSMGKSCKNATCTHTCFPCPLIEDSTNGDI